MKLLTNFLFALSLREKLCPRLTEALNGKLADVTGNSCALKQIVCTAQ